MDKFKDSQTVFLLVGKNPDLKDEIVKKLVKDYNLQGVYSIIDPLRVLLNKSLNITLEAFNKEKLKNKKMYPSMQMNTSKLSKLILTFREMLPRNHPFNPYTVGEGKYFLGPLDSPKHAMLEVGNKFVNDIMPLFCATLTYAAIEGKSGLYLVTGIRKKEEVDFARSLFQNVFTIRIPTDKNSDEKYNEYATEKSLKLLETDYSVKNVEKLEDIIKKMSIKELPIKNASRVSSELLNKSNTLQDNVLHGGKEGRFIYEPRSSLPSHSETVVWLKPLSQKD